MKNVEKIWVQAFMTAFRWSKSADVSAKVAEETVIAFNNIKCQKKNKLPIILSDDDKKKLSEMGIK